MKRITTSWIFWSSDLYYVDLPFFPHGICMFEDSDIKIFQLRIDQEIKPTKRRFVLARPLIPCTVCISLIKPMTVHHKNQSILGNFGKHLHLKIQPPHFRSGSSTMIAFTGTGRIRRERGRGRVGEALVGSAAPCRTAHRVCNHSDAHFEEQSRHLVTDHAMTDVQHCI